MEGDLRPQVRARGSLSTRAQHVSCCRAHGGGLADGAEHGFGTGATASVTQATRDSAAPHPGVWGPAAAIFPAGMGVEGGARRRPVGLSLDVSGLTTWRFPVAQGLLVTHFWGTAKPQATNGTSVLSGGRGLLSRSRLLCKQRISQRPGGGRQPGRASSQLGGPMRPRAPPLPRAPDAGLLPSPLHGCTSWTGCVQGPSDPS